MAEHDELMAEAERLLDDPTVPRDPEKREVLVQMLRDSPEVLPHFIKAMKRKVAEREVGK